MIITVDGKDLNVDDIVIKKSNFLRDISESHISLPIFSYEIYEKTFKICKNRILLSGCNEIFDNGESFNNDDEIFEIIKCLDFLSCNELDNVIKYVGTHNLLICPDITHYLYNYPNSFSIHDLIANKSVSCIYIEEYFEKLISKYPNYIENNFKYSEEAKLLCNIGEYTHKRSVEVSKAFIEKNNHESWCWYGTYQTGFGNTRTLSQNPNLTLEFIETHFHYKWHIQRLTKNKIITEEFIEKHIEFPWYWPIVFTKRNISIDFIERHLLKVISNEEFRYYNKYYHWETINYKISIPFILKHPEFPWNWDAISQNNCIATIHNLILWPNLPWNYQYFVDYYGVDIIRRFIGNKLPDNIKPSYERSSYKQMYEEIFKNGPVKVQIIKPPYQMSENILKYVTPDEMKLYFDLHSHAFQWICDLIYKIIPSNFILSYVDRYPWHWGMISCYTDITKLVSELPNAEWNWDLISENEHITEDFIEKHIYKLNMVGKNNSLTIDTVEKYPRISWKWTNKFYGSVKKYYIKKGLNDDIINRILYYREWNRDYE